MAEETGESKAIYIDYTNWKGEWGIRKILPQRIFWGSTKWHPEEQWLLEAIDLDKNEPRTFAMKDIHSWGTEKPS